MDLKPYLEDLQRRINPDEEERLMHEWMAFADLKIKEGYFAPSRTPSLPTIEWKPILINDALNSDALMIYHQLYLISETLRAGGGEILSLRSNYGTGIIPGMFDAEVFMMPLTADTLPGTKSLHNGKDGIQAILASGKMDFSKGFAKRVFDTAQLYLDEFSVYPELKKHLYYYNPDLQGPLSLCEAMWGSDFYLEFYDDPETVKQALDFFTDLIIKFTNKWLALMPQVDDVFGVEWGCLHKGHIIIRNDTAMNVSADTYKEFAMPCDQRIITTFGGGIHFCGRGDHYIEHLSNIRGMSCINLSQPDWNDMEKIYQHTVDKDIIIFGLHSDEVQRTLAENRPLHGKVHRGASVAAWLNKKD